MKAKTVAVVGMCLALATACAPNDDIGKLACAVPGRITSDPLASPDGAVSEALQLDASKVKNEDVRDALRAFQAMGTAWRNGQAQSAIYGAAGDLSAACGRARY